MRQYYQINCNQIFGRYIFDRNRKRNVHRFNFVRTNKIISLSLSMRFLKTTDYFNRFPTLTGWLCEVDQKYMKY